MREMNEDEKKLFDEKLDYIGKLKDSMTQEELDGLLPKEVVGAMDAPKFEFGESRFYPREDLNDYLESAYSGSPMSSRIRGLEAELAETKANYDQVVQEAAGYIDEIGRLEKELKDEKDARFKAESRPHQTSGAHNPPDIPTFYSGEVNALVFCVFSDWMRNHKPHIPSEGVRSYEVARMCRDHFAEAVDMKGTESMSREFKEALEKAVDEAFSTTPTTISPLLAVGFTDRTKKGSPHWKVAWNDLDEYTFILSKTPSDRNGVENCKRNIIARLCI